MLVLFVQRGELLLCAGTGGTRRGCGGGETIVRRNVFILMTAKGINVFSLVIITGMNITNRDEHDRMNMFTTTTTPTTGMFLCVIVYQSHCVLVL